MDEPESAVDVHRLLAQLEPTTSGRSRGRGMSDLRGRGARSNGRRPPGDRFTIQTGASPMPEVLAWIPARNVFVFVGSDDDGRETRSRTYTDAELRAHLREMPMRERDIDRV